MTMVHKDRFLIKWVDYYGGQLGMENLYVFFDGEEQDIPPIPESVNIHVIPKMQGNVASTDRQRARFMSNFAKRLFDDGADMVIATDADEFLVVDPLLKTGLAEFLSSLPPEPCYSGLGVDVIQRLPDEGKLDFSRPFLEQRAFGWLHPRYTKTSIITRPLTWGSGYHRVKHKNFHIADGLYLFHFGGVDMESLCNISAETTRRGLGWRRHQMKRFKSLIRLSSVKPKDWETTVRKMRIAQTWLRPINALNKPTTFGLRFVVRIHERFKKIL